MNRSILVMTGLISLSILTACGGGASKPISLPQIGSESGRNAVLNRNQQSQLQQSINKIKSNTLSKDFAVTTSFPYVITGNISAAELEHWKSRVHRTQSAIKSMYFKHDPAEVVQIWLFKDRASYFQYNQSLWNANPGTPYGYYLPKQKRMMMNIASGGGTLTHELIHPYIERNFPNSPLWFNEGLASLYEQSYYRNGKVFGAVNWRLAGLKAVIKADSMPSLSELIQTNRQQFLGANREIYYAQSRYIMLYLQSKNLLVNYYHQFVANSASDKTGMKTLLNLTGHSAIEAFEADWLKFIRGLRG